MRREVVTCDACKREIGPNELIITIQEKGLYLHRPNGTARIADNAVQLDLCGPKCLSLWIETTKTEAELGL